MKKIFAMILAAAMMLAVTACSAKPEEKETVELPEGFDPHYTATVIKATTVIEGATGVMAQLELPMDILGEVNSVTMNYDNLCSFTTTEGYTVMAQTTLNEKTPPDVTLFGNNFIVLWIWNGIDYLVSSLDENTKNALCAWVDELFELPGTKEIVWNKDVSGLDGVDFYNGSYHGISLAMHVAENWSVNDFLEYMGCSQVDVELRYRGLDFYWYRSNLYQMQCLTFSYEKDGKTNYITTPFDGESDISYMDDLLNLFPAEPIETFTDAFGAALPA